MLRVVTKFLVLFFLWLLLSGQLDWKDPGQRYLLFVGVVCCAFVTYLSIRKKILDAEGHPIHLTFQILYYLPWLFWEIFLANLDVAYRVWHPGQMIDPTLIKVGYDTRTSLGTVTYANSITLTPGTITVSVDEGKREMLVHALSDASAKGLLSGKMHQRVKRMEGPQ